MNPNNLVCRTCLGIISEGNVVHNIDDENGLIRNVRNIREMIMFCVPEMDIYISISPVICESCLGILVSVYNFKIRCLRVENAIRSYVATNNVMEGSCVNLNNVVRQQIVEALKQKSWPAELINEYVDKHLCMAKTPQARPTMQIFQAMTQKFNAPRMLNNQSPRPPGMNVIEPLLPADIVTTNSLPPPYAGPHIGYFRTPTPVPQGSKYISVSKNLMPSGFEGPSLIPQLRNNSELNTPLVRTVNLQSSGPIIPSALASVQGQGVTPSSANLGDFQHVFLNALQLTSTASGGREEAVLLKKKEAKKRTLRKPKKLLGSQNFIPIKLDPKGSNSSSVENVTANVESTSSQPRFLCPTSGLLKELLNSEAGSKLTGLRKVRKSVISHVGNNNNESAAENNDIIILDDDTDMVTQKVGDEMLLMNFDENVDDSFAGNVSGTSKTTQFHKKMFVKLPMIDKETLKRKLTPEDILDEIISKRRKLIVKVNSSLPYLHKNKKLIVNVKREKFYFCPFCRFVVIEQKKLNKHYMSNHKVCSRCNFKCDRPGVLTQHINAKHPLDLQEALKKFEDGKTEYHCYLCRFVGLSEFDLRDHRLRVHVKCNASGMYKCPYLTCTKENPIAYVISKHIETVHDKLKQTQCPLCNYISLTPSSMRKHIESHSMTKMRCHFCCFGCKTLFSLNLHLKKKHGSTQERHARGMVYTPGNGSTSYNDDYRITLNALQSGTGKPPEPTPLNSAQHDQNKELYANTLPSFGEMLCSQTFTEEASDQEGDCTIVSDAHAHEPSASEPQKRSKGRRSKNGSEVVSKRRKSRDSGSVEDPDDCMIVVQEIPTVDLSDDEDTASSNGKKKDQNDSAPSGSEDAQSSSDVIEIEDHNDDCFVISDDVPVTAESSTQESTGNVGDTITLKPRDANETDTCLESSGSVNIKDAGEEGSTSNNKGISGSDTDNPRKTTLQDIRINPFADKENIASIESSVEGVKLVEGTSIEAEQSTENKDEAVTEKGAEKNKYVGISQASESLTDKNSTGSSDNTSSSDPLEVSKDPGVSDKSENAKSPESDQNTSVSDTETMDATRVLELLLDDRLSESSKHSEPEKSLESRKEMIVPDIVYSESVLIESSDEDSNDCTFVSESNAPQNADGSERFNESKNANGSETNDNQHNSEIVIGETSLEKDVSEPLADSTSRDANSEESKKKLEVVSCDDNIATDEASCIVSEISDEASEIPSEKPESNESSEECSNKNNELISIQPNPDSDDNIISRSEQESPALEQICDNEISKETAKESSVTDCEIFNSDFEVSSENIEISESTLKAPESIKNNSDNLQEEDINSFANVQETADVEKSVSEIVVADVELEDIETSETDQKTEKSMVEDSVAELEDTDAQKIPTTESATNKEDITLESALDSKLQNIGTGDEGLYSESSENADMDLSENTSFQDSVASKEVQPAASRDNLVQVACADSTVSDNTASNDSKSTQKTLDDKEDESNKTDDTTTIEGNRNVEKVVSSDSASSKQISEEISSQKHLDVTEKEEEWLENIESSTLVSNLKNADVHCHGENISEEDNVVVQPSDS